MLELLLRPEGKRGAFPLSQNLSLVNMSLFFLFFLNLSLLCNMEYKDELLFKYFSASMNAWPYLHRPGSEERSEVCTVVPFFLYTNSSYSYYTVDTDSEFPYLSAKLRRRNLENRNHVFVFCSISFEEEEEEKK